MPISARLLLPKHLSRLVGGRVVWGGVAAEKPALFSTLWAADDQQRFKSIIAGKRKRDTRNFSGICMGDSVSPDKMEHLHMVGSTPSQDLEERDSKKSGGAFSRRSGHPENANELSSSIFVDPPFLGFLIGKGGATRKKIEKGTGVTLLIPLSKEAEAGKHVELRGESQEVLEKAKQQVLEVIDQAIKSPQLQYSHFVSIPLALHSKLLDSVLDFQDTVLESGDSSSDEPASLKGKGIDESIFIRPATFHLTLLMLKLWNRDRVQAATDCFQRVLPRVHETLGGSPLTIKLTGVACMNDNPAQAHVLYADVETDDQAKRLVKASQVITEAFKDAGLVMEKDQTQTLKLHATLMNTRLRSRGGNGRGYFKRIPFDATDVMTKFERYEWGSIKLQKRTYRSAFVMMKMGTTIAVVPFHSHNFQRMSRLRSECILFEDDRFISYHEE